MLPAIATLQYIDACCVDRLCFCWERKYFRSHQCAHHRIYLAPQTPQRRFCRHKSILKVSAWHYATGFRVCGSEQRQHLANNMCGRRAAVSNGGVHENRAEPASFLTEFCQLQHQDPKGERAPSRRMPRRYRCHHMLCRSVQPVMPCRHDHVLASCKYLVKMCGYYSTAVS